MVKVLASIGRFLRPVRMAQILSGATLYLGAWLGILKVGVDPPDILLFFILLPAACALATAFWYRLCWNHANWPRPEIGVIVGLFFFIPLVFVLTAGPVFGKPPLPPKDSVMFLVISYCMFPLTVVDISTYSGLLGPLFFALISILVTGKFLRKRRGNGEQRTAAPPANPGRRPDAVCGTD